MVWLSHFSAPFPSYSHCVLAFPSGMTAPARWRSGRGRIHTNLPAPMPFPAMTDPSRGMNDPDIPLIYAPAAKMKIRLVGVSPDKFQPHHPGSAEVAPFLPEIGKSQGDRKWARIFMGINGSAFMRIKGKNFGNDKKDKLWNPFSEKLMEIKSA